MKKTSTRFKRILTLVMAMVMVLAISVPSFAAAKSDEDSYVTVYVTQDMFTAGGFDNGPVAQAYINSQNPEDHPNTQLPDYVAMEIDIATIKANLATSRAVYDAPSSLPMEPNVLDAIITATEFCGYPTTGSWDLHPSEGEPGGYISSVGTVWGSYQELPKYTYNGVKYDHMTGSGWNIACTQDGTIKALTAYGSNYTLSDGMVIVFDYSPYDLYDVLKN